MCDTVRLEAERSKVPSLARSHQKKQYILKMGFLVAGPKLNARVVSGILHKIQCNSICSGDPYRLAHVLQEFFKPSQIWRPHT